MGPGSGRHRLRGLANVAAEPDGCLEAAAAAGKAPTQKVHPLPDRQGQAPPDERVELPIALRKHGGQRCSAGSSPTFSGRRARNRAVAARAR